MSTKYKLLTSRSFESISFGLFQALTATLFLRPAEMFEAFQGWPIYESLIIATGLLSIDNLIPHFYIRSMRRQPITLCVILLIPAIVASHLTHAYFGGAIDSVTFYGKTVIFYGLLITTVNSPTRLQWFMANIVICTSIMTTLCVFDYWEWIDLPFINHVKELQDYDVDGNPYFRIRMCGTGIFEDPNDLSMVIVASGILSLYFVCKREFHPWRFLWLIPLVIYCVAMLETKSRGGMLATVAATVVWLSIRYGRKVAIFSGVCGALILPLVAGRSADIEFGENSTATERLELWREGFEVMKTPEAFFGLGQGLYGDFAGLVAHNSYLHAFVELGLFGGTLFFGCFYFATLQLIRMIRLPERPWLPKLMEMYPNIAGALVGWMMSMFSLSRCYSVPTYLILGLCAAYCNLYWIHTTSSRPLVVWGIRTCGGVVTASAMMFIGLYLMMKVMV